MWKIEGTEDQDTSAKLHQNLGVIEKEDIWKMKDADDFLRYFKFEAINYGYLYTQLSLSIFHFIYFLIELE